jgi:protein-disulfide isomerase
MSTKARLRTQQMRAEREAAARRQARRRRIYTALGGIVIAGLIGAIVVAVVNAAGKDTTPATSTGRVVPPKNLTSTGAIPVGSADAAVAVELYVDYMCPACGKFEAANAAELDRFLQQGTIRIELRPISFLDRESSGTKYSTRAASAVATVADGAPDKVWAFHTALYQHQPAEGSTGLTDAEIAAVAADAGVPAKVIDRFDASTYRPWVGSVTRKAFASGVDRTPTINLNGVKFEGDPFATGPLTKAIESAAAGR